MNKTPKTLSQIVEICVAEWNAIRGDQSFPTRSQAMGLAQVALRADNMKGYIPAKTLNPVIDGIYVALGY